MIAIARFLENRPGNELADGYFGLNRRALRYQLRRAIHETELRATSRHHGDSVGVVRSTAIEVLQGVRIPVQYELSDTERCPIPEGSEIWI